ncbi:MAG TPA: protein kinase [Bryobacteraceae bacterium]|nr:protein kinase [Bryobacteraceae bacterium]
MAKCSRCSAENPDATRFCGYCGAALGARSPASLIPTEVSTRTRAVAPGSPTPRSDSSEEGRFLPGTLLGDRYRIVSLLGSGGMGEVYRASDLRLGQPVALKFLPEETARDPKTLARFHSEVRIARQVAHPNVCRVYDIGEVEGHPYISMEYVDGEDLHSLLRRIGRLPPDKAVEIARKLCAGLAAAHDKGVLHRDLKPANIMIDGRGHVLITDFGLASVIGQIEGVEARNGTPGYMAPEQLSGKEVSAQSDIYALGVVLYEMFTGKRPFPATSRAELLRLEEEGHPPNPRSIVKDIDPAVENVTLRCLDPDPRNRPSSALAVLGALPGGDPLEAALAAGETPSPEMVAAAGAKVGLKPRVALAWLAATLAGLVALAFIVQKIDLLTNIPFDNSPEVLAGKAQEISAQLGYAGRGDSTAYGFEYRPGPIRFLLRANPSSYWQRFAQGRPATMRFWYRSSPAPLAPRETLDVIRVTPDDPPNQVPGMRELILDPQGRLLAFEAVPPRFDDHQSAPPQVPDWNALFQAAGLDPARFHAVDPQWTPRVDADVRAAWSGSYPEAPDIPIRIEAAGFQGKPVYFEDFGPWSRQPTPAQASGGQKPTGEVVYIVLQLIVIFGSIPFARYNLRQGRGDTRGAIRLGLFATAVGLAAWLIGGAHVGDVQETDLFFRAAMRAVLGGVLIAVNYVSFEPFVRRRWPQTLISWSRLLAGTFRDPLVGKDVLIGVGVGIALALVQGFGGILYDIFRIPFVHTFTRETALAGGRFMIGESLFVMVDAFYKSLGILFLLFLARMLLRKQWLAAGVVTVALAGIIAANITIWYIGWPVNIAFFGIMVLVLVRFGLLALVVAMFVSLFVDSFPLGTDLSVWYAGEIVFTIVVVLVPALFALRTALAGQRLLVED